MMSISRAAVIGALALAAGLVSAVYDMAQQWNDDQVHRHCPRFRRQRPPLSSKTARAAACGRTPGSHPAGRAHRFADAWWRASDLQRQLPAGVQPIFMGVLAPIKATDARGKLFLRLMTLPEDLFFLALVWLVRNMVLSAWGGHTGEVTPFIRDNVRRLRWIAGLLGALWVYHVFLPTLTNELSFYSALNDFGSVIGEDPQWYLTNGSLGVALLLLILAQVFSYGVRLQKDVEGLV